MVLPIRPFKCPLSVVKQGGKHRSQDLLECVAVGYVPIRMNQLETATCLLKGRGRGKTHVTPKQEKNIRWEVLVSLTVSA